MPTNIDRRLMLDEFWDRRGEWSASVSPSLMRILAQLQERIARDCNDFYPFLWMRIEESENLRELLKRIVRPPRWVNDHLQRIYSMRSFYWIGDETRSMARRAHTILAGLDGLLQDEAMERYRGFVAAIGQVPAADVSHFCSEGGDLTSLIRDIYNRGRRFGASAIDQRFVNQARRLLDRPERADWQFHARELLIQRVNAEHEEVVRVLRESGEATEPIAPWYEDFIAERPPAPSRCACCNAEFLSDSIPTADGRVCRTCLDEDYFLCERTNEFFHINDQVVTASGVVVSARYAGANCFDCVNCEETFRTNERFRTRRGYVCGGCHSMVVEQDEECDEDEESVSDDLNDEGLHMHDFKPRFKFYSIAGVASRPVANVTYVGVEHEIEAKNGMNKSTLIKLIKQSKFWDESKAYLKHDGSLNYGLELVMHPTDIKSFDFGKYRQLLAALLERGARSYEPGSCGLHVHIGRSSLGGDHETKLCRMMYRFKDYLHRVSKRGDRLRYCNFLNTPSTDSWREDRYKALNLLNSKTVEFRFFRGTLNGDSAVNSIKFCEELAHWTCKQSLSHLCQRRANSELWKEFLVTLSPHLRAWVGSRCAVSRNLLEEDNKYNQRLLENDRSEQICA